MRIDKQPAINAETNPQPTVRADGAASSLPAPNLGTSSSALSLLAFSRTPSFELLSLDAALTQIPPVRADVLAQTIQRLAAGDLQTPHALEQTANAILSGK